MGIKQLTSYVRDNFSILYTDEFYLRGQKLVFDGGALYYGLIRNCDKRFGGDYHDIYKEFKSYFLRLKQLGVTPYIVLDGGSNIPLKNGTICERFSRDVNALRNLPNMKMSQHNLPKPRLLKLLLIEVLIELQINYVLAKGEADMLVAALANRLNCPLVSGDSDFFVIPVLHGVITVDSLISIKPHTQKIMRYRLGNMAKHLKVVELLIPFLAVLMGNDYSDEVYLDRMQIKCGAKTTSLLQINDRVKQISSYLSRFNSIDGVAFDLSDGDLGLNNHIRKVLNEFQLDSFKDESNELFPILSNVTCFKEKVMSVMNDYTSTETFLKHSVYHGLINPCVLDIHLHKTHFIRPQCESLFEKASSEAAEKLRSYVYVLLLHENVDNSDNDDNNDNNDIEVNEFKRSGHSYEETCIQSSVSQWCTYHPIDVIKNRMEKMEKIRHLCNLTSFPINSLKEIKEEDQMFIMSVRYWVQRSADSHCNLKIEYVHAIILCYIHLNTGKHIQKCHYLDQATSHHYCRWQSIVFYLIIINVLYGYPFIPPVVSRLFHGSHIHHLHQLLESGVDVYTQLTSEADHNIFNTFINTITTGLTPQSLLYKRNKLKRGRYEQQQQHSSNTFGHRPSNENRFGLLRK